MLPLYLGGFNRQATFFSSEIHGWPHTWKNALCDRAASRAGRASRRCQNHCREVTENAGASDLCEAADEVWKLLRDAEPADVHGLSSGLHELSPATSRKSWQELGGLLTSRETPVILDGRQWVSLRLDGCVFGKLMKNLRDCGLIGPGYSDDIGQIMRATCRAVMDEFKASLAFTHSDEMTLLFSPGRQLSDGSVVEFMHKGRVQKWVSISASVATALFNRQLTKLAEAKGVKLDDRAVAHFDSRVGLFDSQDEALPLVLWRAYDCSVNCAQDACHYAGAPLNVTRSGFSDKLLWLQDAGLLPMNPHQAYGSLYVKGQGEFEAILPDLNQTVRVNRSVNIHVNDGFHGPRNLLLLPSSKMSVLPDAGDARMQLRNGSFWRFVGSAGKVDHSHRQHDRQSRRSGDKRYQYKKKWDKKTNSGPLKQIY